MTTYYTHQNTPAGKTLLVKQNDILTGLHWEVFRRTPAPGASWIEDSRAFEELLVQLEEYYQGKRQKFDLKFAASGTPFQTSVWRKLEDIPYGASSSYQEIANAIDKPAAVRAVGTAIGNNPISILIPCHRVLTSDQKLGGYAGGLEAKQLLLRTENIPYKPAVVRT